MYIECHFNRATGDILGVWEADHQPYSNPAEGWKPFAAPAHPVTGEPIIKADGTLDEARLPADYGVAKIDLDYATQLLIEQGAYDARVPRSQWIMDNLMVDLPSVKAAPVAAMKRARLAPKP